MNAVLSLGIVAVACLHVALDAPPSLMDARTPSIGPATGALNRLAAVVACDWTRRRAGRGRKEAASLAPVVVLGCRSGTDAALVGAPLSTLGATDIFVGARWPAVARDVARAAADVVA